MEQSPRLFDGMADEESDAARWRRVEQEALVLVRRALERVTDGVYVDPLIRETRDAFDDLLAGVVGALSQTRVDGLLGRARAGELDRRARLAYEEDRLGGYDLARD